MDLRCENVFLGAAAVAQLYVGATPWPVDLVERFAQQARERTHATAVEGPEGHLTYGELDRLSNRLAHRLQGHDVHAHVRVGVSLSRGVNELVALLAVLKAGGVYVPLDPTHPEARLGLILEDARPELVLVDASSPLASRPDVTRVALDNLQAAVEGHPDAPLSITYRHDDLAYILFTSGSTGRPKGVEIQRGAFANFLQSMAHTPGLQPEERVLAITTTSFDIAGLELFLPLWVGATVVIADRKTAQDARLLRRFLAQREISVMQATPATWRLLLDAGWAGDPGLRKFCGGEALYPELAARLLEKGGELWNLYGPTETTVWSTVRRLRAGDPITIGREIDETQVHILDNERRPVPDGQEGEIYIGGRGLARGYFGRPELTAERFVQSPFGPEGERIYKTGDLGRRRPDGDFECLGRVDDQVKIRGFRVELGEVEAVLRSVPGVHEVVVLADKTQPHDPKLVAYWVGDAKRTELILAARAKLPAYFIPAAYCALEEFPLNTNGKIDRGSLPTFEFDARPVQAPRRAFSVTEARVAQVWCDVLRVPRVELDDDFFTIGGTSPLALEVVDRIEQDSGLEVPVHSLFNASTLEGFSSRVGELQSPDAPIVVKLREGPPNVAPLWCIFGVRLYRDLARSLTVEGAVMGIHVPFRYRRGEQPRPTVEQVASAYVREITQRQPEGPYRLLGLCFGGVVAYEVAARLEARGSKVDFVAVLDALLPAGVRTDVVERVRDYVRRLHGTPLQFIDSMRERAKIRAARFVERWQSALGVSVDDTPVDLSVVDAACDADVARFAARPQRIRAPLLVVRATNEARPTWCSVDPDLGWHSFSRRVIAKDIPAKHLEILAPPHVGSLAAAVDELLAACRPRRLVCLR